MIQIYRFLALPNEEQCKVFVKTVDGVRLVYKLMLHDMIATYRATGELVPRQLKHYLDKFVWLRDVDVTALNNVICLLESTLIDFSHKKSTYPLFDDKEPLHQAYTSTCINGSIAVVKGRFLKLPTMGLVRVNFNRKIPANSEIKSVTFSQEATGNYHVAILIESNATAVTTSSDSDKGGHRKGRKVVNNSCSRLFEGSLGIEEDEPSFYQGMQKRIAREELKLSNMQKGSTNYRKQQQKVVELQERLDKQLRAWERHQSC